MDIGVGRETRSEFSSALVLVFVTDPVGFGDRPLLVGYVAHGNHE